MEGISSLLWKPLPNMGVTGTPPPRNCRAVGAKELLIHSDVSEDQPRGYTRLMDSPGGGAGDSPGGRAGSRGHKTGWRGIPTHSPMERNTEAPLEPTAGEGWAAREAKQQTCFRMNAMPSSNANAVLGLVRRGRKLTEVEDGPGSTLRERRAAGVDDLVNTHSGSKRAAVQGGRVGVGEAGGWKWCRAGGFQG